MIREEVERLVRPAYPEAAERARRHLGGLPEGYDGLVPWFEVHPFGDQVGVRDLRLATGITCGSLPDGTSFSVYLARHRVWTALRMLELADGRLPTGRVVARVGFKTYRTWCRVHERVMRLKGKAEIKIPPLVERPERLRPRFDELTWYLAWVEELLPGDAAALIRRLRHRYPGALSGSLGVLFFPPLRPVSGATRPGGIAGDAAALAVELAAALPSQRLHVDGKPLPGRLSEVMGYGAGHLLEKGLNVTDCCGELNIRDKGISTQVLFHLGESPPQIFDRRRIEAALPLVAARDFTIREIAGELGMDYGYFLGVFERRTGVQPGEIRDTVAATSQHPLRPLWLAADGGGLKPAEVRMLASYLRGLQVSSAAPRVAVAVAFEHSPPPALAVRRDVDSRDVHQVLRQYRMTFPEGLDDLVELIAGSRYSAAQSYLEWVRDRLGRADLELAWATWEQANRRLEGVLELPRGERLAAVCRDPECQTDAFLWILVDCVGARLFHDAAESEHFADLAVAAADARWGRERSAVAAELRALALALKANALRRRNELERASEMFEVVLGPPSKVLELVLGSPSKKKPRPASRALLRPAEADSWIVGRVCKLYASLLYQKGQEQEGFRTLAAGAFHFKEAGDDLERVRCAMERSSGWLAKGRDISLLLTKCIAALERYPLATNLRAITHLNRILSTIYLTDRLSGRNLATIKSLRAAMPPASSAFTAAQYLRVDGLIAALEGQPEVAGATLRKAASSLEDQDLPGDATATWLQYSWAVVDIDSSAASQAAKTAYAYMERTGFRSHGLHKIALKIYQDARRGELRRGLLRRGILLLACPRMEARLATEAEPPPGQ